MISILIVEDQKFPRKAISAILETDDNLIIVGEAKNGVEALELIKSLEIDIALVDLNLPGMNGFELTQKIVQSSSTKVVILSGNEDSNSISKSIKCGARGYLLKNEFTKEQIIDTINRVERGYFQMAPGIFEKLINNALDDKFETEQTLSALENKLHSVSSSSLPDERIRQQLSAELQLKIDNLKLELSQGLNKFQYQVSQQIENDLQDIIRNSQQTQLLENVYGEQHKKLIQSLDFIENNINIIESKHNFSVNKLKQELTILRYCIISIFILLAPILFDYLMRN